jgi:hypothetical protein
VCESTPSVRFKFSVTPEIKKVGSCFDSLKLPAYDSSLSVALKEFEVGLPPKKRKAIELFLIEFVRFAFQK